MKRRIINTAVALFLMDLGASKKLETGRFIVCTSEGVLLDVEATSGLPGHQSLGDTELAYKGPIPPGEYVLKLDFHNDPRPGIEGICLPIQRVLRTSVRGGFMLHRDANVPGTQGCIGLRQTPNEYAQSIQVLKQFKQPSLDLWVRYA